METIRRETRPGRILVIDESSERTAQLVRAGFEAEVVKSEKQALSLVRRVTFDAVLVDVDLLGDQKMVLCRRLRDAGSAAAVVALVSERSNELALAALEAGVLQVFEKTITPSLLQSAMKAAVARARSVLGECRGILYPFNTTPRTIAATTAKNEFGVWLEAAVKEGAVVINKHETPAAILVSFDRVHRVLERHEPDLLALSKKFDEQVARMRTNEARAAARGLFASMTPEGLGEAAVRGARKKRGGR